MRWLLLLPLVLCSCAWIGRQADAAGEYMPVIGDRCEHWQCMTASGQAESDAIKAQQQAEQKQPQPLSSMTPIYPADASSPPPVQAAPTPAHKQFPLNASPGTPDNGTPPL